MTRRVTAIGQSRQSLVTLRPPSCSPSRFGSDCGYRTWPDCAITCWYRVATMSTQIALRLPDEVVAFIDAQVRSGRTKSRSEFVVRFVERERRRERAARDVEVLLAARQRSTPDGTDTTDGAGPADGDLDALVALVSSTALDLD